jgi:hypothetical protein
MRRVLSGVLACGLMASFVGCGEQQDASATSVSTKKGQDFVREEFSKLPVPTKPQAFQPPEKK